MDTKIFEGRSWKGDWQSERKFERLPGYKEGYTSRSVKGGIVSQQQERVEEFTQRLEGAEASDRSLREIVEILRPQAQELAQKQLEMARTELAPVGKKAGIAAGILAAGGIILFLFAFFLAFTGVYLLNLVLPLWLSALIISVVLLVIGGILAGVGASRLRSLDPVPRQTISALQQNVEWVKGQFRS